MLVGGLDVDGEPVGGPAVEQPPGQHHEAAVVAGVAHHPGARHLGRERDRRRRGGVHGVGEGHHQGHVDGHAGAAVTRGGAVDHRRRAGGDRPGVVEAVDHAVTVGHPRREGEVVLGVGREGGAGVVQHERRRVARPGDEAARPRVGVEGAGEVAVGDRRVDVEARLDGVAAHRVVEHHANGGVGGDTGGAVDRRQLDDLRRRGEAAGEQHPTERRQEQDQERARRARGRPQKDARSAASMSMPAGDPAPALTSMRAVRSPARVVMVAGSATRSRCDWV